jgi:hypothetical protein
MAGMDIALHYYSRLTSTFIAGCLDTFVSGYNVLESLSFPQNLGETTRQNYRTPDDMESEILNDFNYLQCWHGECIV